MGKYDKAKQKSNLIQGKEKRNENIIQKIIRRLFFKSKKKKDVDLQNDTEKENDHTPASKDLDDNDSKLNSLSVVDKAENKIPPSIQSTREGKPPLPISRRLPSSATTAQATHVSQLDAALKQFKLST